jgi:hypothetical protein
MCFHWDQINPELHAEALQIGVKTKLDISQRLFREKGASVRIVLEIYDNK